MVRPVDMPAARSLAHALVTLARAGARARLQVRDGSFAAEIVVVAGKVTSLTGTFESSWLGDELVSAATTDEERARLRHALSVQRTDDGPLGEHLIATEGISRGALAFALRRQARHRMATVFQRPRLTVTSKNDVDSCACEQNRDCEMVLGGVCDLVLDAMRSTSGYVSLPRTPQRLTSFGSALVDGARLWPQELAALAAMRSGEAPAAVAARFDDVRVRAFLSALSTFGGLDHPAEGIDYTVLLRKLRQLDRSAAPHELLELQRRDARGTRRALRQLTRAIHPDKLVPGAPATLRAVATDVLGRLADAEAAMRSPGPRRSR